MNTRHVVNMSEDLDTMLEPLRRMSALDVSVHTTSTWHEAQNRPTRSSASEAQQERGHTSPK